MTVRSWTNLQYIGTASPGHSRPRIYDAYAQNGTNASRAERLAGVYKPHAYNMSRTRYVKPPMTVRFGSTTYNTSTDACGAQPVYPNLTPPSSDEAVAKLLSKWRASDLNVGVSLGEGREAAEMMVNRMLSIASAARNLRRKNFGGALASLAGVSKSDKRGAWKRMTSGDFASAWLELQYGWKPLLNDIYAASDLVSEKAKPRSGIFRSSVKTTGVILGTSGFPPADVRTVKCERRINLMVKVTNTASLPERLGLTDPFSVMWELTRFSFVADWFLPIGDSLLACHAKQVMKTSEACTTQIEQKVSQFVVRSGQKYGSWIATSSAVAEFDTVTMQRTVSFGVPGNWGVVDQIPGLLTPTWDPPATRMLNAAALARTNLIKLR